MASSTARALELLELLQSAGLRSVGELADRLALDERSVRRHIDRLRELGIPVETVRGRAGGYRIASSYRLPPLMLSDDEAIAVLTGLTVARGENRLSADSAMATAIAKIQRSLPPLLARRVEALLDVIVGSDRRAAAVDADVLLTAADGIRARRPLAMTYLSKGDTTRRTIQPHDLVAYNGRWYLSGLDSLTRAQRAFRLDRVRSLRALAGSFPAPAAHDAAGDLVRGFATADYRHTVILRVEATAAHVALHLPPSVAMIDDVRAGSCRVTIRAESLEWLPRVLLTLDSDLVIEQPEELRAVVLEQSARLARLAR